MTPKPKPKVTVNAGATVIVEVGGEERRFNCSGTNEKTGHTPEEVIKNLSDCIKKASAGKARRKKIK